MSLVLVDILRYLASGLFSFFSLNNSKKIVFAKSLLFSIVYTAFLISFKLFVLDNPIITIVSAITIFVFLIVTNELNNLKAHIAYSLFITCLTEYIHFLFFGLFSINRIFLGIVEVTASDSERLLVSRIIVFVLYFIAISLIYIFKKVDIGLIIKLSRYKLFHIILSITLCIVVGLKYCIKYTTSNMLHFILSVVFAGFIVLSLVFMLSSKTFINQIEKVIKKRINPAIEDSKIQKSKSFTELKFSSEELNSEMNYFLNLLHKIGMNTEDKKSKQIAYCAVLLNHEENPQETNMISVIYPIVGDILNRQAKTIESNISNAIKTHWFSCRAEILEKIKMNYKRSISPESGCPGAKEFLLYLTQKYKEQYPEDEIKSNAEYSFFKKHLLNIQN